MDLAASLQLIRRGTVEIISEAELSAKLAANRPLIIKAGFDPTTPDLHLGHTVLLRKLRHFQDLNHRVVFLIGDATALVGDPSGQSATRKILTREQVQANATTYFRQVGRVLKTDNNNVFSVVYNSDWFLDIPRAPLHTKQPFDFIQFVNLASRVTVARLIERDDFSKRLKTGKPVSFLELFYPIMQGYDSVKIADRFNYCDIELGGTDQKFNLLMGRELLKAYSQPPQVVITMPLLEGTDGVQKMSKSLGNHVGINEPPNEMFGKLMSIPDTLIVTYFTLLTDRGDAELETLEQQLSTRKINPRDAKADLAWELVKSYHSPREADAAKQEFFKVFSKRELPTELPALVIHADADGQLSLVELLVSAKLAKTKNEARRLLKQGAVKLNGKPVTTPTVPLESASNAVLQIGSRHFRKLRLSA